MQTPPGAAAVYVQCSAVPPTSGADIHGQASDDHAASGLHTIGALPRTPFDQQQVRNAPRNDDQRRDLGVRHPAQQVREFTPCPHAHNFYDTTHEQSRRSPDHDFAPDSEFPRDEDSVRPSVCAIGDARPL